MSKDRNNKKGFTLAEVLITLTIIGVVAALTIPSLLANVSDKTYDAKRKGLATRMAQAISQLDALNSYAAKDPNGTTTNAYIEENSSVNFITEGLSKVYQITNICEFENFAACDFPAVYYGDTPYYRNIKTSELERLSLINQSATATLLGGVDTKAAVFKTKNGESILLWYNPRCVAEQDVDPVTLTKNYAKELCVNMIYDLDGASKGPNSFSKDLGQIAVFYPDTPFVVAPYPLENSTGGRYNSQGSYNYCHDSLGSIGFLSRSIGEWNIPTKEEMQAWEFIMFRSPDASGYTWTSSIEGSESTDYGWMVGHNFYAKLAVRTTLSNGTHCVVQN